MCLLSFSPFCLMEMSYLFVPVREFLLSQFTTTAVSPLVFFHFFPQKNFFHLFSTSTSVLVAKVAKKPK